MKDQARVVYLLGAGASCNAHPLAVNLLDEFNTMATQMEHGDLTREAYAEYEQGIPSPLNLRYAKLFRQVASRAAPYGTIDNYAKRCQVKRANDEYRDIIKTLSAYFLIQQLIREHKDNRYCAWLTRLIDMRRQVPQSIRILNWNYDFQVSKGSS